MQAFSEELTSDTTLRLSDAVAPVATAALSYLPCGLRILTLLL